MFLYNSNNFSKNIIYNNKHPNEEQEQEIFASFFLKGSATVAPTDFSVIYVLKDLPTPRLEMIDLLIAEGIPVTIFTPEMTEKKPAPEVQLLNIIQISA